MKIPKVKIDKKCTARLLQGHLWVFDNEIMDVEGAYTNGDIVQVTDHKGRVIGKGYINDRSKIVIRILTFRDEEIDRAFFRQRIEEAVDYRRSLSYPPDGSFRVVFSEGDLLPGLIVDKYGDILSLQILTLGMERWKEEIVDILKELLHPETIIERSDVEVRRKEGLEPTKGVLWGKGQEKTIITLNDLKFEIDLMEGHKTGFYLDQQENRAIIKPYVAGKRPARSWKG
ncbi:MAG: class I SAM-dependent rRNA methyltransferase [Nitrospirae bacterium]|nr:class I SAM-dependent rRNA methyltransferase [Nitrospirota bacterium]